MGVHPNRAQTPAIEIFLAATVKKSTRAQRPSEQRTTAAGCTKAGSHGFEGAWGCSAAASLQKLPYRIQVPTIGLRAPRLAGQLTNQ